MVNDCNFYAVFALNCLLLYLIYMFNIYCEASYFVTLHLMHTFWVLQITRRLLGKILIDLRNTREEAISVAELKSNQDQTTTFSKSRREDNDYQSRSQTKNDDTRRSSSTSEKSLDQDDDDDKETKYRLDPKCIHILITCLFFFSCVL